MLARELAAHFDVFIAFPEDGRLWLLSPTGEPQSFPGNDLSIIAPYNAPQAEASLAQILEIVRPDLVHIVHFVYWHLGVIDQITASGLPTVASFHDFFLLTPHWTMQGQDARDTLLRPYAVATFGEDVSDYLQMRRAALLNSLQRVRALIVPSPYLRRQLEPYFPFDFQVIEYGIHPFEPLQVRKDWPELRFGYVGGIPRQKGWESLLLAFEKVRCKGKHVKLRMYGGDSKVSLPDVTFHGQYNQTDLPQIMSEIDVGVVPSLFAETYSLALSEMWQGKVIAAVSDIGALGERVVDGVNGKKFRAGDIESIAQTLEWFATHQEWRCWTPPTPRVAAEMAEEYRQLYLSLL